MLSNSIQNAYGLYHLDDKACATCANWVHPIIKKEKERIELFDDNPSLKLLMKRASGNHSLRYFNDWKYPAANKLTKTGYYFYLVSKDYDAVMGMCSVCASSYHFSNGYDCNNYCKAEAAKRDDIIYMNSSDEKVLCEIIIKMINELKQHMKNAETGKEEKKEAKVLVKLWNKRLSDLRLAIVKREQTKAALSRPAVTPEQLEATNKRIQDLQNAGWWHSTYGGGKMF
ncbi:MAG: hypothetical protein FWE80_05710 [Oscillospiraceae bacterium]|nr:hypothetical protein [Oscillospiraceae bacterium]